MQLRSERRFRFDVAPDELWAAIAGIEHYRRWWPWLREFEARGLHAGDVWRATVQPPLPYSLSFTIALSVVEDARRVTALIDGDIGGTASLELDDLGGGCEASLISDLAPRNRVLRSAARLAGPVVRFGHDWVLDTGARQFVGRAL